MCMNLSYDKEYANYATKLTYLFLIQHKSMPVEFDLNAWTRVPKLLKLGRIASDQNHSAQWQQYSSQVSVFSVIALM